MAGDIPCILDKASEEAKGAVGCVIVEFFGLLLGLLLVTYAWVRCCLGAANEFEEDLYASRRLRIGSEDEDSQSGGDIEQIETNFTTGLIGHDLGGDEAV
jgi:hypothetical protein